MARTIIVILRPRPHKRLVIFFFVHRWLIIVVISLAANSARTTCIARLLYLASCFSFFFFYIHLYYSTLSNFFLYLQRHLYRVSHHSSACWFKIAIIIFVNKTLLLVVGICYRYFYSSETDFKHTLITKLCYQVLTVAKAN